MYVCMAHAERAHERAKKQSTKRGGGAYKGWYVCTICIYVRDTEATKSERQSSVYRDQPLGSRLRNGGTIRPYHGQEKEQARTHEITRYKIHRHFEVFLERGRRAATYMYLALVRKGYDTRNALR